MQIFLPKRLNLLRLMSGGMAMPGFEWFSSGPTRFALLCGATEKLKYPLLLL